MHQIRREGQILNDIDTSHFSGQCVSTVRPVCTQSYGAYSLAVTLNRILNYGVRFMCSTQSPFMGWEQEEKAAYDKTRWERKKSKEKSCNTFGDCLCT